MFKVEFEGVGAGVGSFCFVFSVFPSFIIIISSEYNNNVYKHNKATLVVHVDWLLGWASCCVRPTVEVRIRLCMLCLVW